MGSREEGASVPGSEARGIKSNVPSHSCLPGMPETIMETEPGIYVSCGRGIPTNGRTQPTGGES